ncbi:hypothetical protein DFH09DRAFT_395365 [Mycena vulgaris]|nr:hypothetical protein DFH09DRAFT_395365 [Mycena vulgaris]
MPCACLPAVGWGVATILAWVGVWRRAGAHALATFSRRPLACGVILPGGRRVGAPRASARGRLGSGGDLWWQGVFWCAVAWGAHVSSFFS